VASPPGGGGGGLVTTGAGDGDGAVVGLGTGDGLGDGLGLGDGGVVGDGDGLGLGLGDGGGVGEGEGLGLGAGAQSMTVIELEAVPFRPSEDCHSTLTVTTSPFSAEIGNVTVWERPLQETVCTSPSILTVAECVPVLGKKSNVTLTSSQWILMATVWASDAVAAPRTRPTVIINTAAILVFGLMSPPLGSPTTSSHPSVIKGVGHSYHVWWGGRPPHTALLSDYRGAWPSKSDAGAPDRGGFHRWCARRDSNPQPSDP
jgi:hypothetical protein